MEVGEKFLKLEMGLEVEFQEPMRKEVKQNAGQEKVGHELEVGED